MQKDISLRPKGISAKEVRKFNGNDINYLKQVLDRGELSLTENGFISRFEKAFAEFTGAKIAIARANCMVALAEAVSLSDAGPGSEIICDPIVHFGALASAYFNSVPRFADVDYGTYNMDPDSLEENITENTKAVIVTNIWGLCAELDKISEICKKNNLFLIEDCAHSIHSYWKGKHAGTFGDMGCFSFQEYKQLSTGDGGMSITNNPELYERMQDEWFRGESPNYMVLNFRMNELTAAIGLAELERVKERIENLYNKNLKVLNDAIKNCEWLKQRFIPKEAIQSGYWFVFTWEGDKYSLDYNKFKKLCDDMGLGFTFGFAVAAPYLTDVFRKPNLYKHPYCPTLCPFYTEKSNYRYKKGLCPNVENLQPRLITIPLILMSKEEAERKSEMISEVIKKMEK